MADTTPRFRTLGDLAEECGISPQRADYIIRSRRIPHQARAGIFRLFDAEAVHRLRIELRLQDARREGRNGN